MGMCAGPDIKKSQQSINHCKPTKKENKTEKKKKKINNSVSNCENIKKALVTDGKSEKGRRKTTQEKASLCPENITEGSHPETPLIWLF